MADVFISYTRDERAAVERIAQALGEAGFSVWFDASLSAGESFSAEIDREVRDAPAILVCWSPAARSSKWVLAEAQVGFAADKLVAAYVAGPDGFSGPVPFNGVHTEDLRAWLQATTDADPAWRSLVRRVGVLCGREAAETPAPRARAPRKSKAPAAESERKLTTILAIDIVGYSASAERDQAAAMQDISALRARIAELAGAHGGRVFHSAGDGFMLEFPLASAAVRAAVALLSDQNPAQPLPPVRAGAHVGEVMLDGDNLLGHAVNVAARLVAQAAPNALVISDAVKSQLHGEIDAQFAPMGSVHLAKMRETVLAYAYTAAPPSRVADLRRRLQVLARRRWRVVSAAAVLLVTTLVGAIWLVTREDSYVLEPMQLVAHSRRPEMYPSLSPDGRSIVYMVETGPALYTHTDLYMRTLAGGEEVALTNTADYNEGPSAFSPTGDRLAYARWRVYPDPRDATPCEIVVRVLPNGIDRPVGACESYEGPNRLSWTPDGRALIYADGVSAGEGPTRIRVLDLETGDARDLVPPPERGFGDTAPVLSIDGRRVAFVRYQTLELGDVFVYDLQSARLARITNNGAWAQTAWADSNNLFLVSRTPGAGIQVNLKRADGGGRAQMLLPALANLTRPAVADGVLAFQVETIASNLWRSGASGGAITDGNQSDGAADFSRDGTLAFLSGQANDWIYIQARGEAPRRLVDVSRQYADGLRWSPDGRRLVHSGMHDGFASLFITDVASGLVRTIHLVRGEGVRNPAWSPDGQSLIFASTGPDGAKLMRVGVEGSPTPQPVSSPGWFEAIETTDGLFAINSETPGIWRLAPNAAPELVFADFHNGTGTRGMEFIREWAILNGRIYVMDFGVRGRTRILSRALSGGPVTRIADVDDVLWGSLAVDPVTGDVVYAVAVEEQYDIGVIRFRRR